ncbi:MAG: peptide ABC transporter substrate-binding protein, partial [Bauldia sp.]|nr:peptide ABC transporter substrate-binding protein [Bauldia sp.]
MRIPALSRALAGAAFAALALSAALPMATTPALAEMVWNRGNSADPESLDPHKTATIYEAHIIKDLFEGLVTEDVVANPVSGAAESWTISDDGTVYTFKIRDNAVWSNGDPVTADDFVFSFRRLLDPATGAEYASMLYVVKNGEDANGGKVPVDQIGVTAIDAKTLEVTLQAPTPYFLEMLQHQATFPVNPKNLAEFGDDWVKPGNMVSNGAFTLAEFIPNDHITVVRSPTFHDAANVKLDKVVYWPTEDRSTAMKRYEAGELDSNDDFPTEQLADLKAKFGDQLKLGPYLGTYYYAMKWDKEPWSNVQLRNAVSMAIDRDFLAEKVWNNTMVPAYGMVPPGISGYASYAAPYAGMSQIDREDEAAKIL